MRDEFYIGYLEKYPQRVLGFIKITFALLIVIVSVVAWLLASNQRGFIESTYEYYQETEITGLLITEPLPAIQIPLGVSISGDPVVKTVPIVQFGKTGGATLAGKFEGAWVTARGFLIYYDGRALIEIANPDHLTLATEEPTPGFSAQSTMNQSKQGTYQGEILDAKCYFGVMKPGHGKPHRSCAIRCISGGIPAILHTTSPSGQVSYYILKTTDKNSLLKLVGETVTIQGEESQFYDWNILEINELNAIMPISELANPVNALTMCY